MWYKNCIIRYDHKDKDWYPFYLYCLIIHTPTVLYLSVFWYILSWVHADSPWCLQCRHEHRLQPLAEVCSSSRHSAIWHGSHDHHVAVHALLGETTELLCYLFHRCWLGCGWCHVDNHTCKYVHCFIFVAAHGSKLFCMHTICYITVIR